MGNLLSSNRYDAMCIHRSRGLFSVVRIDESMGLVTCGGFTTMQDATRCLNNIKTCQHNCLWTPYNTDKFIYV
jgi:hypothetical protein